MYEYKCTLLRVVDGDTIDVDIDLGFKVWLRKERVRMVGIDTPESRTRNLAEKKLGLASKARLKELLPKTFMLVTHKDGKGKFGRILGEPIVDHPEFGKINICNKMVEEGHARVYTGGTKVPWIKL
jgi:micrococcal nuclease|tara:strand:- start:208 stop:585 length:378 start_codon:yes stop_codon:yes gene_type:complete